MGVEVQVVGELSSKMHAAEGVVEAAVTGPGINKIDKRQLAYSSQPLDRRGVDELSFFIGDGDVAVDRVFNQLQQMDDVMGR